ncbi:MAG TPA: HTTM domain-containing protein, partial [Bacteroidetes bacterium]|nr:HTTM domain-containing protein [Bacteroidota bacterium]
MLKKLQTYLEAPLHIAPLVTFRVLFGGMMFTSILRFILKGWVTECYVIPKFYFTYTGFSWIHPLGEIGMYVLFGGTAIAALFIMFGLFYRLATTGFFLSFTYLELLDKTNYLNHYYFISIVAFLLIWIPANAWMSIDVWRKPILQRESVPRWMIGTLRSQMGLVYCFAGIAKLNSDWLFRAMPLRIWLPANSHLPLIGGFLKLKAVAFVFSWFGAIYDLLIPFFLLMQRIRPFAYLAVIGFHAMTAMLFQIGMFPYIMILSSLIFFPATTHKMVWDRLRKWLNFSEKKSLAPSIGPTFRGKILRYSLIIHFSIQLFLPFRYLLYPENLFWHEQGFRFSWRVMLMEKAGYATFIVHDPETGGSSEVSNRAFLTANQEKMMATQPDMILQFAHFLKTAFQKQG